MKSHVACIVFLALSASSWSQDITPNRPRITGIDHVEFYTTQPEGVTALYGGTLGLSSTPPLESGELLRYRVGKQWVGFRPAPDAKSTNRLDHVAFATENVVALRDFLAAKGVKADAIETRRDHSRSFFVTDPEGNRIEFVERDNHDLTAPFTASALSHHLIHAGFLVHDRGAEDRFYGHLLGFHLYWQGGMQPGKTDWAAMQLPDGTDWLEYMLNQPEHPDLRTMGVLDHISLGVADMKRAQAKLEEHGWKPHGGEKAQMGKDGKWQLNLFDPDLTRIELMEFKPVEKPCCSEFTGPHPAD
jgi:catechol 2,3-dioxygenase-like lactoylglutathione lyase family enzyme